MDYSNETPERYWVTQPEVHRPQQMDCATCGLRLDRSHSIPYKKSLGGLCQECATQEISNHPMTTTYLDWLTNGDPRWWSVWLCNCKGCVPSE